MKQPLPRPWKLLKQASWAQKIYMLISWIGVGPMPQFVITLILCRLWFELFIPPSNIKVTTVSMIQPSMIGRGHIGHDLSFLFPLLSPPSHFMINNTQPGYPGMLYACHLTPGILSLDISDALQMHTTSSLRQDLDAGQRRHLESGAQTCSCTGPQTRRSPCWYECDRVSFWAFCPDSRLSLSRPGKLLFLPWWRGAWHAAEHTFDDYGHLCSETLSQRLQIKHTSSQQKRPAKSPFSTLQTLLIWRSGQHSEKATAKSLSVNFWSSWSWS